MEVTDQVLMFVQDYLLYVRDQFAQRTVVTWLLFFFPLVIFFELPRYLTPVIMLPLMRLFQQFHRETSAENSP